MNIFEKLGIGKNKKPSDPKKNKTRKIKNDRLAELKKDKKAIFFICLKTFVSMLLAVCFVLGGVLVGGAIGYITISTPVTDEQLSLESDATIIYDLNGNVIAELNSTDNKNIIPVDFEDTPKYLRDAIVAIEDQRFYKHQGVDIKRTAGAILELFFGDGGYGGSTITQQLVKNVTGDNSNSISRKIREIWRALQLEQRFDKDEILEYYMNIIFMGHGCYGVQAASLAYFDKDVSTLSLAECAFLAGITNNPSYYNPLTTKGRENAIKRQGVILKEMLKQGYISEEEYESALAEELVFNDDYSSERFSQNIRSYFIEHVILTVRSDLMELGYTRAEANNIIYGSGSKIYTTMDQNVQDALTKVYSDVNNFPYNAENPDLDSEYLVQSASVIIDPQTGYILGLYGGSGEKEINFGLNRATQINRQPGSTLKPIMIYGPLLDNGTISLGSIFDDVAKYMDSNNPERIYPNNFDANVFKGPMTVTTALAESNNVIPATLFKDNMDYCLQALANVGIDRTSEKNIATALGGLSEGISPLLLAAAYVPYANNGFYYEPVCYTKIVDANGKTILEHTSEAKLICSEETTPYLMTTAMQKVVTEGTAKGKIDVKDKDGATVPVAGKTGTTDNYRDSWFVGYTPDYVGATWYGFDSNEYLDSKNSGQSTVIWNKVMQEIYKNRTTSEFTVPSQIVSKKICKYSGLLATDLCARDPRGDQTTTEYYSSSSSLIPTSYCTNHVEVTICNESGKLANSGCTSHTTKVLLIRPFDYSAPYSTTPKPGDLKYLAPTDTCTVHTPVQEPTDPEPTDPSDPSNPTNPTDPTGPTNTPDDPGVTDPATTPGDNTEGPDNTEPPGI